MPTAEMLFWPISANVHQNTRFFVSVIFFDISLLFREILADVFWGGGANADLWFFLRQISLGMRSMYRLLTDHWGWWPLSASLFSPKEKTVEYKGLRFRSPNQPTNLTKHLLAHLYVLIAFKMSVCVCVWRPQWFTSLWIALHDSN